MTERGNVTSVSSLDDILASFELEQRGTGHFRAPNAPGGQGVIFGGQLLAQSIMAAQKDHNEMTIKTIHTLFARGGNPEHNVEISVEPIHSGRTVVALQVRICQGDRVCTASTVLLTAPEDDFIAHGATMPDVSGPDECAPVAHLDGWDIGIVNNIDVSDPDAIGPPELNVWSRFPDAPRDDSVDHALLGYASDGFLIGTAMRPHAGVGQAQAHVSLATGVLTHTLTFHEPFCAADWLLLAHRAPHAGGGRSFGSADVFTQDGRHVASFVQDAMIRKTR